jgi:hypothetical protein
MLAAMKRDSHPILCPRACGTELVKPLTGPIIRPFLLRINSGDMTAIDDLNKAYSVAVRELNKEHLTTCTGPILPTTRARPSD